MGESANMVTMTKIRSKPIRKRQNTCPYSEKGFQVSAIKRKQTHDMNAVNRRLGLRKKIISHL